VNYKIITYNCGCKYVFITDPAKRILKNSKLCPIHGKSTKHVELWCIDCSVKITETNRLAWQRKKRCLKCAEIDQRKRAKENWRKNADKYNKKKRGEKPKKEPERPDLFAMQKQGALKRLYRRMSIELPVVETPILDRLLRRDV